MRLKNLIITRFSHGAAGKFLSTVLQTSKYVDHWSPVVKHQKSINQHVQQTTLAYCDRAFPIDHSFHMLNEPMVPYCTDLYSSTFDRGHNVTADQYWNQNDIRLQECQSQKLHANIIFNKPKLPVFCNNAKVLTILLTTEQEQKWVYTALWSKHFIETSTEIIYTPNSPEHCALSAVPKLLEYKPKYKYKLSEREKLYNQEVMNNQTIVHYTKPHSFFDDNVNNIFFNLGNLFNVDMFISKMEKVFDKFELGALDHDLVSKMYQLWWSRQCS